jgi:hypothetical protein
MRPNRDAGRRWRFRTIPDLELPADIGIPTCTHCGEQLIDGPTDEAISLGLRRAFRVAVLEKAKRAIETLRETFGHRQRTIERALGLSHGYLSKIVAGEREPSPTLTATLLLLANDAGRLEELRGLWSTAGTMRGAVVRGSVHLRVVKNDGGVRPYTASAEPDAGRASAASGAR